VKPARLSRRAVLGAALASACAPRSELPRLDTFLGALPRDVAGAIPYEPERLGGQVVLVTFIATWCFPCLAELVVLSRLARDFGKRGFANVLVGMDLEGRQVLEPFAMGYELPGPLVVADDRLRGGETPFGRIRELPSRVLFGRDGKPVLAFAGVAAFEDLAKVVAAELDRR
jgi:thiol-disulfide isomerase/thioredoxin